MMNEQTYPAPRPLTAKMAGGAASLAEMRAESTSPGVGAVNAVPMADFPADVATEAVDEETDDDAVADDDGVEPSPTADWRKKFAQWRAEMAEQFAEKLTAIRAQFRSTTSPTPTADVDTATEHPDSTDDPDADEEARMSERTEPTRPDVEEPATASGPTLESPAIVAVPAVPAAVAAVSMHETVRHTAQRFGAWFDRHAAMILLVAVALLVGVGTVLIFSSSAKTAMHARNIGDSTFFLKKHLTFLGVALIAAVAVYFIGAATIRRHIKLIYGAALVLLALVLIPGIGTEFNGARRWIRFFGFGFQPSDFAKLALIIAIAHVFSRPGMSRRIHSFDRGFVPFVALVAPIAALTVIEPDLGTTLFICATATIVFLMAGGRVRHIAFAATPLVAAMLVFVIAKFDHVRPRIEAFLSPEADPLGSGYQIRQSLIALGAGGPTGVGLGQSRQALWYLPEESTDFIFAILGEEFGFLGTAGVLLAYLALVAAGLRIAACARDRFLQMLAAGLTLLIGLQAAINIAVVTASVPNKGIALPFISFGGSLTFFYLVAVALILGVARQAPQPFATPVSTSDDPPPNPDDSYGPRKHPTETLKTLVATPFRPPVAIATPAPVSMSATRMASPRGPGAGRSADETVEMPESVLAEMSAVEIEAATLPRLRVFSGNFAATDFSAPIVLETADRSAALRRVPIPATEKLPADETAFVVGNEPVAESVEDGALVLADSDRQNHTIFAAGPGAVISADDESHEAIDVFDAEDFEDTSARTDARNPMPSFCVMPNETAAESAPPSTGLSTAAIALALDGDADWATDDFTASSVVVAATPPNPVPVPGLAPVQTPDFSAGVGVPLQNETSEDACAADTVVMVLPASAFVPATDAGDSAPNLFAVNADAALSPDPFADLSAVDPFSTASTAANEISAVGSESEVRFDPPPPRIGRVA